ncbi:RNA-binding protein [Halocatena pleomorpha]|uniref:MBL fold metallo-hydrolase n=1 Tax=Halocatena pleomorpha TaxID=1785090 RepID=A0A3P3R8S0_9EURY|nr:hypothetical protein [Halocatena pleomorpha]RRJ29847.1 hypothetical protein EIK79_11650 [Halocatena pleomorpha]
MPMKGSDSTELREIDRWEDGVGWIAYPDEQMQRASHALVDRERDDGDTETGQGGVWVVDPVDADDLDELLGEFGEVLGVVVLLDRHKRDAAAIARRHDVAVHRPTWMNSIDEAIDAPVRALGTTLGGTEYRVRKRLDLPIWKEAVLYRPNDGSLLVPESLGTVDYFCAPGERLGVHPMLRLTPPNGLGGLAVERLLVGHGSGVTEDAQQAIRDAIRGSRSRAPSLCVKLLRERLS